VQYAKKGRQAHLWLAGLGTLHTSGNDPVREPWPDMSRAVQGSARRASGNARGRLDVMLDTSPPPSTVQAGRLKALAFRRRAARRTRCRTDHQRTACSASRRELVRAVRAGGTRPGLAPAQRARRDQPDASLPAGGARRRPGAGDPAERHIEFLHEEIERCRPRDPIQLTGRLNHLVRAQQQIRGTTDRALHGFRLMKSSNFVGRSMGSSAGFAP